MTTRRMIRTTWTLLLLVAASVALPWSAESAAIGEGYFISGNVVSPASAAIFSSGDFLSFWGGNYVGGLPAGELNNGPVLLGWFNHISPNPNSYPGGIFPDVDYKDAPFTITFSPILVGPPYNVNNHDIVTGPASDGAVIHGVINGVISSTGQSALVATFESITPFDIASYISQNPGVTYVVNSTLSNPFPIGQLALPEPIVLNLNGDTDIFASTVPEPAAILAFLPPGIALVARRRFVRPAT